MPAEFPLWRLKPEDAARLIIAAPLSPVEHKKFWRKREMRIKHSPRSAPRMDDLKALRLAKLNHQGQLNSYWREAFKEHWAEFPVISVLVGPLLKDGTFFSQYDFVANPYPLERPREPFAGMYSRDDFDRDMARLDEARSLLRENFILGQQGEGPYLDGVIYLKADRLIIAEEEHCKARLRTTQGILAAKRAARVKSEVIEKWQPIGRDEAVALQFKHAGYTVRNIGVTWEVKR